VRDVAAYTSANRRGWNGIAADRGARPAQFFLNGGSTLDEVELEFLPDLGRKSLLHLACANGNDSLSLAVHGAQVTGVDISEVAVEIAQRTADQAGLHARFLAADIYDLPPGLGEFDVVYMSWGGICWMPDLDRWAAIVAGLLKPGGTLALFEHHPVWEVLGVRAGNVVLAGDYFGRTPRDLQHTDVARRPAGATPDTDLTSFVWPVSQVLSAVLGAGLTVRRFAEGAASEMYRGLDPDPTWLPAYYAITASKPGGAGA